jgi:hypothetical protein
MGNYCKILILAVAILFNIPYAWAVRPLITDDAALVGRNRMEIANWLQFDKYSGQLWHSANIGLHDRVELTVAMFWGYAQSGNDNSMGMSLTAPLLQSKILIRDYVPDGFPGIIIAVGSNLPFGTGAFVPDGYGVFSFVAVTQCIGKDENVLIHTNIGGTYLCENKKNLHGLTWGIGTQIKIYKGLHGIGEFVSGDPYVHDTGIAYQLGIRQFISDNLQVDFACGNGIGGGENRMPFWISSGVRYVLSLK